MRIGSPNPSPAERRLTCLADDYLASTATTGTLAVEGTRRATIETVGDADWFKIALQAGYTYQFNMRASVRGFGTLSDSFMWARDFGTSPLLPGGQSNGR